MFSFTAMEDADNRPSNITDRKIKPIFYCECAFKATQRFMRDGKAGLLQFGLL